MKAVEFLRLVWPTRGYYCLATLKYKTDGQGTYWLHKVYDTIEEAAGIALQNGSSANQYFTVLSLTEKFLIDPAKKDRQIKDGYANATGKVWRVNRNMAFARSFFLDLDVGKEDGYATQGEALTALKAFCGAVGLPRPMCVSSGTGIHVYWPLAEDISAVEWKAQAGKLKKLCSFHGLKADPSRTSDTCSVLRVVGTFHLKDPTRPLAVKVLAPCEPIPFATITSILDRAMQIAPGDSVASTGIVQPPADLMASVMPTQEPVPFGALVKACAHIEHMVRNPSTTSEIEWYKLLGVVRFVEDGRGWAHKVSQPYPEYSAEETDKKLDQLERTTADGLKLGPTTCNALAEVCGHDRCNTCWYKQTPGFVPTSSPLVAARRRPKKSLEGIPDPPKPYSRVKDGVMRMAEEPHLISPYDLYPVMILDDPRNKRKGSRWVLTLPRKGDVLMDITTEQISDSRLLNVALGNAGFLTQHDEAKWVQHYMKAYLRDLRRYQDEHKQHTHLGWTEERDGFVLPTTLIIKGQQKAVVVSDGVTKATVAVRSAGTYDEQRRLLEFYTNPMYVRQQFMIGAALAAPLFHMTGHFGTVVNMTGESGASKSTALFTGSSLWGEPESFAINGTGSGGTVKGKNNRFAILSNLPICVDEITNMGHEEAKEMVMSFTQKQAEPIRMTQQMTERPTINDSKSTLMLTTSNNSIHELLSFRNQAGTAGSMRLFEIPTPKVVHEGLSDYAAKGLGEDYMRGLRKNYGHIGPKFIEYVTAHMDEVQDGIVAEQKRLDRLCDARQAERFWLAVAAVTIYTLKLAYRLGMLPYDPALVEAWLIQQQLLVMRSIVTESYTSSVDTILAYVAQHMNNMLIVRYGVGDTIIIDKAPQGELVGRLEVNKSKVFILQSHLKAYCARERMQFSTLTRDLENKGVMIKSKRQIGAGTMFSTGQSNCFQLNLNHASIAGTPAADEITNIVAFPAAK